MMKIKIKKSYLKGTVSVPSSKSFGHRALICGFLSKLNQTIKLDYSQDIEATLSCLKALGLKLKKQDDVITLHEGESKKNSILFCCESASTLRFLLPLTTLFFDRVVFCLEGRLFDRPLTAYEKYFKIEKDEKEKRLIVTKKQENIEMFEIDGSISSQFITGLLFYMAIKQNVKLKVVSEIKSRPYVDLTIDVMKNYGIEIEETDGVFSIKNINYKSLVYNIEADYSLASNYIVFNALTENSIVLNNLNPYSLQGDKHIYNLLKDIDKKKTISLKHCPDLGPILFVYSAFQNHKTTFVDVERLRAKESDRIESMKKELLKTGITFMDENDKIEIIGKSFHSGNFDFDTHNDHRVLMALSVFAFINDGYTIINGAECVNKSYPRIFKDLQALGAKIEVI